MIRGRFAPTPSGRLHLGNIYSLLCAWAHARQQGGEMVLRIEDLDSSRCPRENAEQLIDDLLWMGLDWDQGPFYQSQRQHIYAKYMELLQNFGRTFPCFCSRGELHAAQAPHLSDGRYRYPGTCRTLTKEEIAIKSFIKQPSLRVRVDDEPLIFTDEHYGSHQYNLNEDSGDFIIRRSDGVYAYHLAVVVDDALMGVTEVVRGCDLLDSVPVQLYLYKLLGFAPPRYCHLPLMVGADGRRLAKRDKDLDMGILRQRFKPQELLGLIAYKIGLTEYNEPLQAADFVKVFDINKLPEKDIILEW